MRRELPVILSGLLGLLMLAEYFTTNKLAANLSIEMQNWVIIIAALALALAALTLVINHSRRISRRDPGAVHSYLLLISLVATVVVGIFMGTSTPTFKFIFEGIINPLASAFYAMACFHLASATYRAFRVHSVQASVLLITGVLLMLGRAPVGEAMWSKFPLIAKWIMEVPNMAAMRGIMISSAVGMIGVGLRVLVGIDRTHMGSAAE
jgi:membrane-associated HD superfamily phosphohydrolase